MVRVGLVLINKGVDEVEGALTLHQAEERVQAAEGVPQREHGINGSLRLVHLQVVGTIAAIGVAEEVGRHHAVVEGRIKHGLVRLVGVGHGIAQQFLVPFVVGFLFQRIEVEVVFSEFGLQVVLGAFHVDGGEGDAHRDLLAFLSLEIEASFQVVAFNIGIFHLLTFII